MKWLTLLALALLATSARAQPVYDSAYDTPTWAHDQLAKVSPPLILDVYSDDGVPTFAIEGQVGTNGPILAAGGVLVVRAGDGLEALVIVEPSASSFTSSVLGTHGPNATTARPGEPGILLAPPPLEEAAAPTYHQVSVLVCTSSAVLPDDSPDWERPACETWQALRSASATGDRLGFTLEVNYGIGVYAPTPPAPPTDDGGDPPVRPDDPRRN